MIDYWFELRSRVLVCVAAYVVCFVVYFVCYDQVYAWITAPIMSGKQGVLISQDIMDPLILPLRLASALSFFTIVPLILFQSISFIRPALYENERRTLDVTGCLAVVLFYVGGAISFFLAEPLLLEFVADMMPQGMLFLPTMASYIAFSIDMAIAFGVAFEVPLLLLLLLVFGLVKSGDVRAKREWWVIGIFVVSMILTPPDVYSQIMLAIPMWFMIELVLILGSWLKKDISD